MIFIINWFALISLFLPFTFVLFKNHFCCRLDWFALYTPVFYSIFLYVPFVLILCFSFGIVIKVFMLRKKRQASYDGL